MCIKMFKLELLQLKIVAIIASKPFVVINMYACIAEHYPSRENYNICYT